MKARFENFLDAKYNNYMDSMALRMALILAGFTVWAAAGFTVLKLAV